jgi:hypothetical protein
MKTTLMGIVELILNCGGAIKSIGSVCVSVGFELVKNPELNKNSIVMKTKIDLLCFILILTFFLLCLIFVGTQIRNAQWTFLSICVLVIEQ